MAGSVPAASGIGRDPARAAAGRIRRCAKASRAAVLHRSDAVGIVAVSITGRNENHARAIPSRRQPAGMHHLAVGDIVVTALNDGEFEGFDWLVGVEAGTPRGCTRPFSGATAHGHHQRVPADMGGKPVLIDGGSGSAMGPGHGLLHAHLATLGIDPGASRRCW